MARPIQKRTIKTPPTIEGFKPFGVPVSDLEPVILLYEEYESIRLADYEGMTQEKASLIMKVSRPTFTRIYKKARKTIAQAFIEGKAIIIDGGSYHSDQYWYRCRSCSNLNISAVESENCVYCKSNDLKQLNEARPTDKPDCCICVNCGFEIPHKKGIPCREVTCPKCNNQMMRKGGYHHQLYINNQQAGEI